MGEQCIKWYLIRLNTDTTHVFVQVRRCIVTQPLPILYNRVEVHHRGGRRYGFCGPRKRRVEVVWVRRGYTAEELAYVTCVLTAAMTDATANPLYVPAQLSVELKRNRFREVENAWSRQYPKCAARRSPYVPFIVIRDKTELYHDALPSQGVAQAAKRDCKKLSAFRMEEARQLHDRVCVNNLAIEINKGNTPPHVHAPLTPRRSKVRALQRRPPCRRPEPWPQP